MYHHIQFLVKLSHVCVRSVSRGNITWDIKRYDLKRAHVPGVVKYRLRGLEYPPDPT